MKKLIVLFLVNLTLNSCNQNQETTVSKSVEQNEKGADSLQVNEEALALQENETTMDDFASIDPAKEWLEGLFKCSNGNKFCFYIETEERATTKRFYQFMVDSEEIYGASALAEEEMPLAKKKYKEKWTKIYKLRKDMEPWLFGRAQDDMENIKNVTIEKIADLKYRVFVDYGESYQTLNEVTLIKNKNSFLIDYCDTEYLD